MYILSEETGGGKWMRDEWGMMIDERREDKSDGEIQNSGGL